MRCSRKFGLLATTCFKLSNSWGQSYTYVCKHIYIYVCVYIYINIYMCYVYIYICNMCIYISRWNTHTYMHYVCGKTTSLRKVIHSQSTDSFGVIAAFHASMEPFSLAGWIQYLHSLRFILNNPSPPQIAPESGTERLVDVITYVPVLRVRKGALEQWPRQVTRMTNKQ